MKERMVVVVAHPDDETFGCGSVLAYAAARGVETVVACATRGELGEIASGTGIARADLGEAREGELRAAARELGVARVVMLGWRDSGVDGEPAPESLAAADTSEVAAAVGRVLDAERPTVVVTPDGLDGHRDHVAIRKATVQAVREAASPPARTYLWCLPRSVLRQFVDDPSIGTPDDTVTTVIDTAEHLDQRWRGIRKHASQAPPFDAMPPEMQAAFLTVDYLVRVEPPWPGGPVERELFPA